MPAGGERAKVAHFPDILCNASEDNRTLGWLAEPAQ